MAVLVRILVMALYSSPVLIYYGGDSTRYLRLSFTGYRGLFSDPDSPAGYPAFLDVARWLDKNIVFTVGLQHLFGLATGTFILLLVRKIGGPLWLGLVPAAIVWFSGDFLFLETTLLTESLWMLLLASGLWAAMSSRSSQTVHRWLIFAGTLIAIATLVRSLALPLAVFVALWALWDIGGPWRRRTGAAAAVLVPVVVIVCGYVAIASEGKGYAGLTDMRGFNLYARVGQFADCRQFNPPRGTASLCERTPPNIREGPFYYTYGVGSPLERAGLRADPADAKLLGKFADAAILHQPVDYLRAVGKDLLRYVAVYTVALRPDSGVGPSGMSFGSSTPANQGQTPQALARDFAGDYSGVSSSLPGQGVREFLGVYQEIFRLSGLLSVMLFCVSVTGIFVSPPQIRRALLLFLLMALYLYIAPVALSSYDVRYGVPGGMLLAVAGALGGWSLARRYLVKCEVEVT
jgi:hypothetical protein